MFRVFEMVKREAERYGVSILESEIVGLVPAAALVSAAEFYLQLERFTDAQILENKLRQMPALEGGSRLQLTHARPKAVLLGSSHLPAPRRRDPERAHLAIQIAALHAEHVGGA